MDPVDFYEQIAASEYAYGPAFQGLRAVWRDGADLLAEVALPEAAGERTGSASTRRCSTPRCIPLC